MSQCELRVINTKQKLSIILIKLLSISMLWNNSNLETSSRQWTELRKRTRLLAPLGEPAERRCKPVRTDRLVWILHLI